MLPILIHGPTLRRRFAGVQRVFCPAPRRGWAGREAYSLVRQHGHISQIFGRRKCNVTLAPHGRNVGNELAIRKKVQPCGCISAILASTSRCLFQANVECNFRKTDVCSAPGCCARSALARRSIRRREARKMDTEPTDSKIAEMALNRMIVM